MMRKPTRYFLVLLLNMLMAITSQSQKVNQGIWKEEVAVFTDRTTYAAGEEVLFSVHITVKKHFDNNENSRILYCELITPTGSRLAGQKYLLHQQNGEGALPIPSDVVSGNYYLKFYTRLMRNNGPEGYTYVRVKIINPFKTEVLSGKGFASDTVPPTSWSRIYPIRDSSIQITRLQKIFAPREEVHLNLKGDFLENKPIKATLTVVPWGTLQDSTTFYPSGDKDASDSYWEAETRGVSLTGRVVMKGLGKPMSGARINLSIIGDKDFSAMNTDSTGRFFFSLPDHTGSRDIFLSASNQEGATPEIFIDNDFCSKPIALPYIPFSLSQEEELMAYKLAVNQLVTVAFHPDTIKPELDGPASRIAFFGQPTNIIEMQKYIDLPSLREYFTELPVIVRIKKIDEKQQFRFYLAEGEMAIRNPLVLVDWIVVEDIDKILAMPPEAIERIELVNALYIKGSITYGGIISFISKKGDFAGIDLPTSGTFINYKLLCRAPTAIQQTLTGPNIPDSRNTPYWEPALQLDQVFEKKVGFIAPDTPGKYRATLRALLENGQIVQTDAVIAVE